MRNDIFENEPEYDPENLIGRVFEEFLEVKEMVGNVESTLQAGLDVDFPETDLSDIESKLDDLQLLIQNKNIFTDFKIVLDTIYNWFLEKYYEWFPKPKRLHRFPPSIFDRLPEKHYCWY